MERKGPGAEPPARPDPTAQGPCAILAPKRLSYSFFSPFHSHCAPRWGQQHWGSLQRPRAPPGHRDPVSPCPCPPSRCSPGAVREEEVEGRAGKLRFAALSEPHQTGIHQLIA